MSKHSKNNQIRPFFTYEERRKHLPGWGTQEQRVGKDSLLSFGVCSLCLKPWETPLSCQSGHVYCKECIYSNLLTQKQEISRSLEIFEAKKRQRVQNEEDGARREEEKDVEAFLEGETGALPAKKIRSNLESAPVTGIVKATPGARGHEKIRESGRGVIAFWTADMTPQAAESMPAAPKTETICPHGQHAMRLKQLFPLNLRQIPNIDETDPVKINPERYQCPSCCKTFTDASKCLTFRKCGHVFCEKCINSVLAQESTCYVCSKKLGEASDKIKLQCGGTGFAGHGDNLIAKKSQPTAVIG